MQSKNVKRLTGMALFTALIIGLQLLGSFIKFGAFSISLVLIPIVVGTALYGWIAGAWLGFVFGMVVLMSRDATLFLEFRPPCDNFHCDSKRHSCRSSCRNRL